MADTIPITASLRIERPVDVVRAQYRDIDHHIRNNVHPSIRYQWEPGEPGERKIRTTFSILGIPQFDVSLLEDAEDGSFVIRYLEGSNAGMVLVHKFVPLGPDATDVQLSADAPVTLGRKLLGPLFVAGARQVMKKALMEDKRDLEQGDFKPGTAAGNLEGALGFLGTIAKGEAVAKRAVLEGACLVSAADGDIDPAERDAILRLATLLGVADEEAWLDARLEDFKRLSPSERIADEADRVGADLASSKVASEGVATAAAIGLISEGMSLGELSILRRLAVAAGLPEEMLSVIVEGADAALTRTKA
ncbi:MAG TPA: TerB family tellurite resistance protein [Polyangiaceae bacterium]|nr:TerB family tellurite resistance protein [Polyangiaceae bacterium]